MNACRVHIVLHVDVRSSISMAVEMDYIAQEAFRSKNYVVAVECFTELLSEHGPRSDWLLGKADSLAKSGKLNDAFSSYAHAVRLGGVDSDQLHHLVSSLIDNTSTKTKLGIAIEENSSSEKTGLETGDKFSCVLCNSLLQDPSTYPCGHTFCKSCMPPQVNRVCPSCKLKHSLTSGIRPNVLLCSLLKQYFPKEVKANELRREGNKNFKAGRHKEALDKYGQARMLDPSNPLIASNMSHVNAILGRYCEALTDAEAVCQLRPNWPKGFYRKGAALQGLGRLEESLKAYLQCLMLNPTLPAARKSLSEVLHRLLTPVKPDEFNFNAVFDTKSANYACSRPSFSLMALGFADASCSTESLGNKSPVNEAITSPGNSWRVSPNQSDSSEESSESDPDSDCSEGLWCYTRLKHSKKQAGDKTYGRPGLPHAKKSSKRSEDRKRRRSQRGFLSPTRESDNKQFRSETEPKAREFKPREINRSLVKVDDFECSLCMRLLYEPVTTPCGHTFCKGCIYRAMDHSKMCPLCKDSLADFLAERRDSMTELTHYIIKTYLPSDFKEREEIDKEEMEKLARYKTGVGECEIPVFVCTMAFPSLPCPLHVFEPRYRLMVRQCMQSGTKEFGMCLCTDEESQTYADYGCMLEIEKVTNLADGRSVIKTHGGRRFKVNSRGMRDGYNTSRVEFISDVQIKEEEFEEIKNMNRTIYDQAVLWYTNLPIFHKTRIADFFGNLPQMTEIEQKSDSGPAWIWWMSCVLPVSPQAQLRILSMTSVKERLQVLQHFIQRVSTLPQ